MEHRGNRRIRNSINSNRAEKDNSAHQSKFGPNSSSCKSHLASVDGHSRQVWLRPSAVGKVILAKGLLAKMLFAKDTKMLFAKVAKMLSAKVAKMLSGVSCSLPT